MDVPDLPSCLDLKESQRADCYLASSSDRGGFVVYTNYRGCLNSWLAAPGFMLLPTWGLAGVRLLGWDGCCLIHPQMGSFRAAPVKATHGSQSNPPAAGAAAPNNCGLPTPPSQTAQRNPRAADSADCCRALLLPPPPHSLPCTHTVIYLLILLYLFVGVALASDKFMSSIEV